MAPAIGASKVSSIRSYWKQNDTSHIPNVGIYRGITITANALLTPSSPQDTTENNALQRAMTTMHHVHTCFFSEHPTDLLRRHSLGLNLLTDEAHVRSSLEGALKGDVRRGAAHEADKVVVLLRGQRIQLHISDFLAVRVDRENSKTKGVTGADEKTEQSRAGQEKSTRSPDSLTVHDT